MRSSILSLAIITAVIFSISPAWAQQEPTEAELQQDRQDMQQCIETVRDINSDGGNEASQRDCIGTVSNACMQQPGGDTTYGMGLCIQRESNWWDEWLNGHYQQLKDIMNDQDFTQLRDMQRKWIAFKEAKCQFDYDSWKGGTIAGPSSASCYLDTTADQAITLAGHLGKLWQDD